MTSVRSARAADAEAIARIQGKTWQAAYAHAFPAERLEALDERLAARTGFWRSALASPQPRAHTLVAEVDGPVGFASVGSSRDEDADASIGELYAIYVLPEHWGGGVGRALHEHAIERLACEGFERATLWVLEDNPRARRFYERAGWRLDGAARDDTLLDTHVREVRYALSLPRGSRGAREKQE